MQHDSTSRSEPRAQERKSTEVVRLARSHVRASLTQQTPRLFSNRKLSAYNTRAYETKTVTHLEQVLAHVVAEVFEQRHFLGEIFGVASDCVVMLSAVALDVLDVPAKSTRNVHEDSRLN